MKIISSLPNTGAPTANHDQGEIEDDITPGDGLGTPLREDWINDVFYGLYEIMKLGGLSPDDSVEGATQSQVRNAIQAIANGISAQKFNRATSYTILDDDFYRTIFVDTTAADVTIIMPLLANNIARRIRIIHAKGGTNKVIIAPNAADANTLTNDALAVIWLPKLGDFIDFENNDTVGALLWQSINERITSQLRLHTYAGFGSTDTMIMRMTTVLENIGNMFLENHVSGYNGNTEGLEITALRSGNYSFTSPYQNDAALTMYFGLSKNSSQLTTQILNISTADKLDINSIATGGFFSKTSWTGHLDAGNIVRLHTNAQAPATAANVRFDCTYLGN